MNYLVNAIDLTPMKDTFSGAVSNWINQGIQFVTAFSDLFTLTMAILWIGLIIYLWKKFAWTASIKK